MDGLDWVGRLLGAHGRVLPMAVIPLDIVADVRGLDPDDPDALTTVRGQVEVASTTGRVTAVRLDPEDPPACREALAAVAEADWVVLGPGSWFTSVMPHLLVPELREVPGPVRGPQAVALNLAPQRGETDGFSPERHLEVLREHAPELRLDVVLADRAAVPDQSRAGAGRRGRWAPSSWSPTWPSPTDPRGTTRSSWPMRMPVFSPEA